MSIRVRHQPCGKGRYPKGVEIISVDEFTRLARKLHKSQTERQHLVALLSMDEDSMYALGGSPERGNRHLFWWRSLS